MSLKLTNEHALALKFFEMQAHKLMQTKNHGEKNNLLELAAATIPMSSVPNEDWKGAVKSVRKLHSWCRDVLKGNTYRVKSVHNIHDLYKAVLVNQAIVEDLINYSDVDYSEICSHLGEVLLLTKKISRHIYEATHFSNDISLRNIVSDFCDLSLVIEEEISHPKMLRALV